MVCFPVLLACSLVSAAVLLLSPAAARLNPGYYDHVCPEALLTLRAVVQRAIAKEPRVGASLLRLHFHDCFVNGCDGSILLDDTPTFTGEKTAAPNLNSARGFDVVDEIKAAVDAACCGSLVSCADILAVAARDSVVALGGESYDVPVGRRDATTASQATANSNIPAPFLDLPALISSFQAQGLSQKDLVILSGGHTIGLARCTNFRSRVYNETGTIDPEFAASLKDNVCPIAGGDNNTAPLDSMSPLVFDVGYYKGLVANKGLLHSDQQLYTGDGSDVDVTVKYYGSNPDAFRHDFGVSMIKMGNISPLTGEQGEIRTNCRKVNGW